MDSLPVVKGFFDLNLPFQTWFDESRFRKFYPVSESEESDVIKAIYENTIVTFEKDRKRIFIVDGSYRTFFRLELIADKVSCLFQTQKFALVQERILDLEEALLHPESLVNPMKGIQVRDSYIYQLLSNSQEFKDYLNGT